MKKVLFLFALVAALYASSTDKCMGCHGKQFEKSALGKSKIVADMNVSSIVEALNGYQDGTYGGPMKGLMSAQVKDANVTVLVTDVVNSF